MNSTEAKRVLETALICAQAPLPLRDMRELFDDRIGPDTLRALLDELVCDWEGRGVELVQLELKDVDSASDFLKPNGSRLSILGS